MTATSTIILLALLGQGPLAHCGETCSVSGGYRYYCTGSKYCCGSYSCCYSYSSSSGTSFSRGAITGFVFAGLFGLALLIGLCVLAATGCEKLKKKVQERSRRSAVVNASPASNNNGAVGV